MMHLDCTLRDGGYYNNWDFEPDLVSAYLEAMMALNIDFVEIGLRSLKNSGFKGGFAYSTDSFLSQLNIPTELNNKIGVMINASELIEGHLGFFNVLDALFSPKVKSPVSLVRIACHVHEFAKVLPAAAWLKEQGYLVGFNLMQIADCKDEEIVSLAQLACGYPIDVLYFADSMGSLQPAQVKHIVGLIRQAWAGDIGIHTHDNMNLALANSLAAVEAGCAWVDSTVTGMGRGPGNVQTEYLILALSPYRAQQANVSRLLNLIRKYFKPMKEIYGWGSNPYYYMAGQYGIHPTYIQEMLNDSRFGEDETLAVIDHLKVVGGNKFSTDLVDAGRKVYGGVQSGSWVPERVIKDCEVLILGAGPSVVKHRKAIEQFILKYKPFVIGLNIQKSIDDELIDVRAACHPFRLLADCDQYKNLIQPLVVPSSRLTEEIKEAMASVKQYDFGLLVDNIAGFEFHETYAVAPTSLVIGYALAIATSGKASRILMAGFDGFAADDPRTLEMVDLLASYQASAGALPIVSVTPTVYKIQSISIYAL